VTIDAMGTQTAIAEKIRSKRGEYVLALKENQKNLYEDIRLFLNEESEKRNSAKMGSIKNSGKGTWTDRNRVAGTEKRVERP